MAIDTRRLAASDFYDALPSIAGKGLYIDSLESIVLIEIVDPRSSYLVYSFR